MENDYVFQRSQVKAFKTALDGLGEILDAKGTEDSAKKETYEAEANAYKSALFKMQAAIESRDVEKMKTDVLGWELQAMKLDEK